MALGRYFPIIGMAALLAALFAFSGSMWDVRFYLLCISIAFSGWDVFKSALLHAFSFKVDANTLITVAVIGLVTLGKIYESAVYIGIIGFFIMLQNVFADVSFKRWSDKWQEEQASGNPHGRNYLLDRSYQIMEKAFWARKENEVKEYSRVWARHMLVFIFFMSVPFLFFRTPLLTWVNYSIVVVLIFAPYNEIMHASGLLFAECVTKAAKLGIFSKVPEKIEKIIDTKAVVFEKSIMVSDKKLIMNNIHAPYPFSREEVLGTVAAMTEKGGHTLSESIVKQSESMGFNSDMPVTVLKVEGFNMQALVAGKEVIIGSNSFLAGHDIKTHRLLRRYDEYLAAGSFVLFVAINGEAAGLISFIEDIHPAMFMTAGKIRSCGIENVIMLTREKAKAASSAVRLLGFTNAVSDVSDIAKKAAIQKLHSNYGNVLIVGDVQKDEVMMLEADSSMAVNSRDDSEAFDKADIVITGDFFQPLTELFYLSRNCKNQLKNYKRLLVLVKFALMVFVIIGSMYLWQAILLDGIFGMMVLGNCYIKTKK